MIYQKTKTNGIYKEVSEKLINSNNIKKDIEKLTLQLTKLPNIKTEPDKETLDFWNKNNPYNSVRTEIEIELNKKKELLNNLEDI